MIVKRTDKLPIYIMIGVPGSGKSTWVKKNLPGTPIVSRDIIRAELGYCKEGEKVNLSRKQEEKVTQSEMEKIKKYITDGTQFVVDDTNLNSFTSGFLRDIKKMGRVTLIGIKLNTPLETCIRRRTGEVPKEVIEKMWKNQERVDLSLFDDFFEVDGA